MNILVIYSDEQKWIGARDKVTSSDNWFFARVKDVETAIHSYTIHKVILMDGLKVSTLPSDVWGLIVHHMVSVEGNVISLHD